MKNINTNRFRIVVIERSSESMKKKNYDMCKGGREGKVHHRRRGGGGVGSGAAAEDHHGHGLQPSPAPDHRRIPCDLKVVVVTAACCCVVCTCRHHQLLHGGRSLEPLPTPRRALLLLLLRLHHCYPRARRRPLDEEDDQFQ